MARASKAPKRTGKKAVTRLAQSITPAPRKPRLLWANPFCMMDTSSGASISVRQMLIQLQRAGYEVDIVGATVFDNPRGIERMADVWHNIQADPAEVVTVNDGTLTHRLVKTRQLQRDQMTVAESNLFYTLYTLRLDTFRPDVVFFYGGQSADFHIPGEARLRGIPSVAYLVNAHYVAARWCRDVDLILTDTQATSDMYARRIGFKPVPVGKFIDPANVIAKRHDRQHATLINPSLAKGAGIVAMLARLLEDHRPDITFEVVESRGNWAEVVRAVTRHMDGVPRNALKNVIVTPNTAQMSEVYERSRVVLGLSQWWESGSRVLAEAMLNGIPAIVSNHGGSPEMVGEGGIVVDLPPECHEPPYTTLPKPERLAPIARFIEQIWDEELFYLMLMTRSLQQGIKLHRIEHSTERLLAALAPLVSKRAGDHDPIAALQARHKHGLSERPPLSVKPVPKVTSRQKDLLDMRVLVLTLTTGEPQFGECAASVLRQDHPWVTHHVISNLPNYEAHRQLYGKIMESREGYDVFLKLDGDMALAAPDTLTRLLAPFQQDATLDHLVVPVQDWLAGVPIIGAHLFSNRVIWPHDDDHLFVDPDPQYSGRRQMFDLKTSPAILHMENPDIVQSYFFGLHRIRKIVQHDRTDKDLGRARVHLSIFHQIWRRYQERFDIRRFAALLGAEDGLAERHELGHKAEFNAAEFEDYVREKADRELIDQLGAHWNPQSQIYQERFAECL